MEYSNDYQRGYAEGIEAGRAIAIQMVEDERRKQFGHETCKTCKDNHACDLYKDGKMYDHDINMWCDEYKPKSTL